MSDDLPPVPLHNPADSPSHWHPQRAQPLPPTARRIDVGLYYSIGPTFGDQLQAARAAEDDARARASQTVRRQIKPRAALTSAQGIALRGGDEVTLEHLNGDFAALGELIRLGVISEIDDATVAARAPANGGERDRFRVNPARRGSIVGRERVLDQGAWVNASDFAGQEFSPAQPEQPARLGFDGIARPGVAAVPERPGITGEQILQNLVARGLVVDTWAARDATSTEAP